MKNSSVTIGNRTRDLSTSSAVPQPNEPPRTLPPTSTESKNEWSYTYMVYLRTTLYIHLALHTPCTNPGGSEV